MKHHLVVRAAGAEFPLVTTPAGLKQIIGDGRSERAIRADCENGVIPTLPRPTGSGAHHRIPVPRALEQYGIPYEIVGVGG